MMRTDFTSNALADTHTFHFGVFLSSSHAPIVVLTKEKEKFNVLLFFFSIRVYHFDSCPDHEFSR